MLQNWVEWFFGRPTHVLYRFLPAVIIVTAIVDARFCNWALTQTFFNVVVGVVQPASGFLVNAVVAALPGLLALGLAVYGFRRLFSSGGGGRRNRR